MDASTFDHLTRKLRTAGSRRWLLGLLAIAGQGGLFSLLDAEDTQARRRHGRNRGHHPGKRKGKRKGGKSETGLPCGPENCGGCCNESGCVSGFAQSNQNCGLGGVTCAVCPPAFFCQSGACVCIEAGDICDPSVQPDQCCAFAMTVCNTGMDQTPGICCQQDGSPCLPTTGTLCVPGSGCCCSGVCSGNMCVPST